MKRSFDVCILKKTETVGKYDRILPEQLEFTVKYRKKGSPDAYWYEEATTESSITLTDVRPGDTIEYGLGTVCRYGSAPTFGQTDTVVVPWSWYSNPNCGQPPETEISNRNPLPRITSGEMFLSGDFPVYVKTFTYQNGILNGTGYTLLPGIFGDTKLAVRLENIQINTDRRMIGGEVIGVYDEEMSQIANSDNKNNEIKVDYVVDFIIPPLNNNEMKEIRVDESDGQYKLTITDIYGEEHSITVDAIPAMIQDAMGDVYLVSAATDSDENKGAKITNASETMSSAGIVKKLPGHVGYALFEREGRIRFCNSENMEGQDNILAAIAKKNYVNENNIEINCNIEVIDSVRILWNKADTDYKLSNLKPKDASVVTVLNGVELAGNTYSRVYKHQLNDGANKCELVMKHQGKTTVIATFTLTKREIVGEKFVIEIERTLWGGKRKDVYEDMTTAGGGSDIKFEENSSISLKVLKIINEKDTTIFSATDTKWYVNNVLQTSGARFDYEVQANNPIIKAIIGVDSIRVELSVAKQIIANGNISLDYSAVNNNPKDTALAVKYYNVALSKCMNGDVGDFIKNAPQPIIVHIVRNKADESGLIHQGEASDGAKIVDEIYNKLDTFNCKILSGIIVDADLISKLSDANIAAVRQSIAAKKTNQKTVRLLKRIGRISQTDANMLSGMINQGKLSDGFLDSLKYKITEEDDISEWISFHSDPTISITVNLENLGNDSKTNDPQSDFTRLMAHELLHHWWTHFKKFEKLKWKVIRDKAAIYKYRLADGLAETSSKEDSNQGCSAGAGHERHNPEHKKVCTEQYNY
jgi:hypothetical protein